MFRLIKLIIWITVISGGIFYYQYNSFATQTLSLKQNSISVKPGSTFTSILTEQTQKPLFSKIYLKQNPPDFNLQVGNYKISDSGTIDEFLQSLSKPINEVDIFLTFLEGWNIFDIDEYLTQKDLIIQGEFIEYAENFCNADLYPGSRENGKCGLEEDFHYLKGLNSLEGYLYPDTYAINPNNFTVKLLARKMLSTFHTRVYQKLFIHADSKTIYELITLASIVEKEEKVLSEKPIVAGILKKRWQEGWMIGADITVCYAHRLTSEQCKLSVTKYLYEKNDYNTRQKVGLPAGPIGSPSIETINATLNSEDSSYYYYLHDITTGKIYYGRTEAEHNENKRLYIR